MRAVMIYCEGNHDVVFVTRSLLTILQLDPKDRKVLDLPSPFGDLPNPAVPNKPHVPSLIARAYRSEPLGNLNVRGAQHAPPPTFERVVEDAPNKVLYVVLKVGTDSRAAAVAKLIADLERELVAAYAGKLDVKKVAHAFLFDADHRSGPGVDKRSAAFQSEYRAHLPGLPTLPHGQWQGCHVVVDPQQQYFASILVGLYIFHDPAHPAQTGTLEDHLAPLVRSHWPARWRDAETYVKAHEAGEPVSRKPAERLKATITLAGQPSFPGDPMSVVIDRHDKNCGLPSTSFTGPASVELVKFLQSVPW